MSETNLFPLGPAPGDAVPKEDVQAKADSTSAASLFNEHKGKLAIGVAATLGAMVFYNWWERRLARQDPEGHARLNRLKAIVRAGETGDVQDGEHQVGKEHDDGISSQVMDCPGAGGIAAAR